MRRYTYTCILLAVMLAPLKATAGPYGDDLAKCLVRSTDANGKTVLVKWMFTAMALHPAVRQLAPVSASDRAAMNRAMVSLVEELLTKTCVDAARDAIKYEGPATIEASFQVLGQVAARELFASPDVAAGMAEMGKMFDSEKLKKTLESQ